jgi:hypothetical protein
MCCSIGKEGKKVFYPPKRATTDAEKYFRSLVRSAPMLNSNADVTGRPNPTV